MSAWFWTMKLSTTFVSGPSSSLHPHPFCKKSRARASSHDGSQRHIWSSCNSGGRREFFVVVAGQSRAHSLRWLPSAVVAQARPQWRRSHRGSAFVVGLVARAQQLEVPLSCQFSFVFWYGGLRW
ncbi:hypothetical protein DEO72_LG5g751 [Vigna unguiculata]|nr:hypothetical protein DEO72_LG5g751 [Vigna unguiculata]